MSETAEEEGELRSKVALLLFWNQLACLSWPYSFGLKEVCFSSAAGISIKESLAGHNVAKSYSCHESVRPSISKLQNHGTITAGWDCGLVKWIIDDSYLVLYIFLLQTLYIGNFSSVFHFSQGVFLEVRVDERKCKKVFEWIKKNRNRVINDPLGQTQSHASSEDCFSVVLFF